MFSACSRFFLPASWALLAAISVTGCGGGGGGDGGPPGPTTNDGVPRIEPYERASLASLAIPRSLAGLAEAGRESTGPAVVPMRVVLDPLPAPEPEAGPRVVSRRVRNGVARDVQASADAAATAALLSWQPLAGGGQAAAVTFRSEGAAGLRLGLRVDQLPAQAVIRVFGTEGQPVRVGAEEVGAPLYWVPTVVGEEATLQIELPAGTDAGAVSLAVPRLGHLWWTYAAPRSVVQRVTLRAAGTCQLDASCEGAYADEARAVAQMEYSEESENGDPYTCTGTLMADVAKSGQPYFLTADHCVSSAVEADSVITYWFYRSTACGSPTVPNPGSVRLTGGADLLHASASSDVSFLRLKSLPPVGARHAGSLVGQPATQVVVGTLHHAAGDLLKFSEGTITAYGDCNGTLCGASNDATGNFLVLNWSRGTTELGSSGSAIFATVGAQRYIAGHLFAGRSSCANPGGSDYYGRIDRAFPSIKQWLWPDAAS